MPEPGSVESSTGNVTKAVYNSAWFDIQPASGSGTRQITRLPEVTAVDPSIV